MKRLITYFSMLLALLFSSTLKAQVLIDAGPVTDFSAEKKYVIQTHGQDGSTHWMYDAGTNIAADNSMDETTPDSKYLWIITPVGDKFTVQNVNTSRYISIDGTSNGGSTSTKTDPVQLYIDVAGGNCGFRNESGQYIDMSHSGVGPSSWSGGVSGSRVLVIYDVNLEISEKDILLSKLLNRVLLYDKYLPDVGDESIDRGTEIGQYNASDELYNTFINAVQQAFDIVNNNVETPDEATMASILETIDKSYEDIMATLVKLTIADGNYRIVSAMQWTKTVRIDTGEKDTDENPIYIETVTHPTKAMYATLEDMKAMWADLDSTDCRYLWKLTNNPETGFIQMMNIATDGILDKCSQSSQATLSTTSTTEMYFEYKGRTEDRKVIVAMRPSTGGNYAFLHANGHGGGSGNASNIVGWEASAGATQWLLEPVGDEEVQALIDDYAPFKDHELLVSRYQKLVEQADSLVEVATDETRTELITKVAQLSCPFGQNDLYPNKVDGGDIGSLIDGDPTTYYHTAWGGDNVEPGSHWLFATFDQPVGGKLQLTLTRRTNASNDHVSKMDVYGGTDIEGEPESFTLLAQLSFPYTKAGETLKSALFTVEDAYPVYKYVVTETAPTNYNRGYFHMAEFNMMQVSQNETSQLVGMGEIGTKLVSELAIAKEMDMDELTTDEYNALKDAYDAAKAIYVDPTPLRDAIKKNRDVTKMVVIGTDPGYWSAESSAGTFNTIIRDADEYDKAGVYTQAQTDEYLRQIQAGVSDIMSSANPVQANKWYAIRFASEDMYDQYGWQKSNAVNAKLGDLYGNYVSAADVEEDGESMSLPSIDEIPRGQALRFVSDQIIDSWDQVAFRFVALGDSAYVLQHKSGLYVSGANAGTAISLGLTPAIFDVKAAGLGKVLIHARNLKGEEYGNKPVYLHAQNSGHSLVTWTATEVSSNSALYISEIAEEELNTTEISDGVLEAVKPNSMRIWCYPVGFSVSNGELYEFKGMYQKDDACHYAFNKIDEAKPGQPVLYINGNIEEFDKDAEDEYETLSITSSDIAADALNDNGMQGTYTYQWVPTGTVVVTGGNIASWGNTLAEAFGQDYTDCTRDISANTGYIAPEESLIAEGEYDLVFSIEGESTGINTPETTLSQGAVSIYDLSGRKVSVQSEKKGIYIVNKKKVAIGK